MGGMEGGRAREVGGGGKKQRSGEEGRRTLAGRIDKDSP